MSLSADARSILDEGTLCYLAAPSSAGPHVTPVVYVLDRDRIWGTTGRGTTKAKLWRGEPIAGGLVRVGGRSLAFRGAVSLYDALDPTTWAASVRRAPAVARASARFSLKNARFFAGYARDVARVPLAWTPPGRVVFSIDLDAGVLIDGTETIERWGSWGDRIDGAKAFRSAAPGLDAEALPEELGDLLGTEGEGMLGIAGPDGPSVLPVTWRANGGAVYARTAASILALTAASGQAPAALVVDRASAWRAAKMRGVLLRGPATAYVRPRSGRAELERVAGTLGEDDGVVRIRPRTAVWWSGWASGTVRRP